MTTSIRYNKVTLPDGTTKRISKNISQPEGSSSGLGLGLGLAPGLALAPGAIKPLPVSGGGNGRQKYDESLYKMLNIIPQSAKKSAVKHRSRPDTPPTVNKITSAPPLYQPQLRLPRPSQPPLQSETSTDLQFFSSLGVKGGEGDEGSETDAREYLLSLSGDNLLTAMNHVFFNKMDNVDKLESTSSKTIVYDFIKYGVNTLDQDQSKNFIYILPILSMRNIMSNITELWPQDHLHDKNLQDIFKNYVDLQLTPELSQTEELINTLPKEFHNLVMVGDRMRFVLSTYLTDDENVVSVRSDDLISLSIDELYNMVDNLTEDKVKVKSYFITEFIEHFYYTIIPLYSALNPSTRIVIPGVNADKNISTICKLIKDFSSVINMDLV